ncbi:MAG: type II secretion system protein [Candidatus Saccharibacteria bacterium]|nr:type II secretion system protein [Candidatus Saccharibacteria bacterium]
MSQRGFTAVELMVTLFVAAFFVLSGLQLYGVVIDRIAETRRLSEASSVAYEVLRSASTLPTGAADIVNRCTSPHRETVARHVPALPDAEITVVRCRPFRGSSVMVQVQVIVRYGSPKKEVIHATYRPK